MKTLLVKLMITLSLTLYLCMYFYNNNLKLKSNGILLFGCCLCIIMILKQKKKWIKKVKA